MQALIADDSSGIRKIVVQMLRSLGCDTVHVAADGVDAWKMITEHKVDLLLADSNMPKMSGLELTRKVRQRHAAAELPIILLATEKSRECITAAVRAGATGYLVKPFTVNQLRQQIDKARSTARAARPPQQRPEDEVSLIVSRSRRPALSDSSPLVMMGHRISTSVQLSTPANQQARLELATVVRSIDVINKEFADIGIRFYLESESSQLARYIRHSRDHLKLLLLSNEMGGGATTMARLARINQTSPVGVGLLLDSVAELRRRERDGLQKVGVLLLERNQLNTEFVQSLLREQVVSQVHAHADHVPAPEDILERIETDISLLTALPVLPLVYHRIMKLARHRYSELAEWTEAVSSDPISTAMVIRRANSPLYGFRHQVNDIGKAVTLLGKGTVKELIVSDALRRSFKSVKESRLALEDYWAHSLCTGLLARILSFPVVREEQDEEQRREFDSWGLSANTVQLLAELDIHRRVQLDEEADPFVAGMMHDIGKIALAHCYPDLLPMLLDGMEQSAWQQPMRVVESEIAGITHTQVGQTLAANWGLNDVLCQVIATHHEPDCSNSLVCLVHVANALTSAVYPYPAGGEHPMRSAMDRTALAAADETGTGEGGEDNIYEQFVNSGVLETLQLDWGHLMQLGSCLTEDLRKLVDDIRSAMKD